DQQLTRVVGDELEASDRIRQVVEEPGEESPVHAKKVRDPRVVRVAKERRPDLLGIGAGGCARGTAGSSSGGSWTAIDHGPRRMISSRSSSTRGGPLPGRVGGDVESRARFVLLGESQVTLDPGRRMCFI